MSANQTPTPHIGAHYDEIARTVIMAGDPLRAQYMADNYLENPVVVNRIRGMLGFTGTYQGKKVSVMGHGMGIPSISIYTYELFNFYDVDTIIRIGSAGSYHPDLHIGDLVFAQGASTDSNYGAQFGLPGTFAPIADFGLTSSLLITNTWVTTIIPISSPSTIARMISSMVTSSSR